LDINPTTTSPQHPKFSSSSHEFSTISSNLQNIDSQAQFDILEIKNFPTFDEALNFIQSEEFSTNFFKFKSAIGISVSFNENLKNIDDFQLDEMAAKYFEEDRAILINFSSNVDKKFFIRFRGVKRRKMFTLKVTEDHSEDLKIVENFLLDFLVERMKNGESGKIFFIE
jgi:hypothetical protein